MWVHELHSDVMTLPSIIVSLHATKIVLDKSYRKFFPVHSELHPFRHYKMWSKGRLFEDSTISKNKKG